MKTRRHAVLIRVLFAVAVCGGLWGCLSTPAAVAAEATDAALDQGIIYRLDPVADRLVPVPNDELKAGSIYSFYSERHGRHVWSYRLESGSFWHALGEGTTQIARRFDLRQSREEAIDDLRVRDPELAERVDRSLLPIRLRLDDQHGWTKVGSHEVESIYDLETLRRWENHTGKYVPVGSFSGCLWLVHDGEYLPVVQTR